jgi:hypothetical protein
VWIAFNWLLLTRRWNIVFYEWKTRPWFAGTINACLCVLLFVLLKTGTRQVAQSKPITTAVTISSLIRVKHQGPAFLVREIWAQYYRLIPVLEIFMCSFNQPGMNLTRFCFLANL